MSRAVLRRRIDLGVSRRPASDRRGAIIVAAGFCCSDPSDCSDPSTTDYSTNSANYWTMDFSANSTGSTAIAANCLAVLFANCGPGFAHSHRDQVRAQAQVESSARSVSSQDASMVASAVLTDCSARAEWTDLKASVSPPEPVSSAGWTAASVSAAVDLAKELVECSAARALVAAQGACSACRLTVLSQAFPVADASPVLTAGLPV